MKTYNFTQIYCFAAMMTHWALAGFSQDTSLDHIRKVAVPMPFPQHSSESDTFRDGNMTVIYSPFSEEEKDAPSYSPQKNASYGTQKGYHGSASDPIDERDSSDSFNDIVDANTIGSITSYPMRTICKLYMGYNLSTSPQWFVCSGTLVGSNVILTAGHCVYDRDHSLGWPDEVRVIPAYDHGPTPSYGTAYGMQFRCYQGWTNSGSWEWDMAFVLLDRSIGLVTGWLGYGYYGDPNQYLNRTIHNLSYPAASPYDGETMHYQVGTWDFTSGNHLVYSYDPAFGGMSGSSGYWKDTSQNRYVLGLLSHGDPSVPTTGFVRFDEQKFNDLQSYLQTVDTDKPVDDVSSTLLHTYPNPAMEVVYLSFSTHGIKITEITAMDCAGKVCRRFDTPSGDPEIELPIGDLPDGMYLLKLKTNKGDFVRKMIVRRD